MNSKLLKIEIQGNVELLRLKSLSITKTIDFMIS
jgi:hypothetical protein